MAMESEVMVRDGNLPPTAFQTGRLWLHAARANHAPGLFADYTGDLEASRFLPRGPHRSQAQTRAVIDAWGADRWTSNDRFAWSIIDRESDRPIGLFLLLMQGDGAEIHYGLGRGFWGQALATEAGKAVMFWVTGQSHLSTIRTTCAATHGASCRVLEKIGLVRDAFLPGALLMKPRGERLDGWSYLWRRTD